MFDNWIFPSEEKIAFEWKLEYVNKNLSDLCGGAFDNVNDFISAVNRAEIVEVNHEMDSQIYYRSHTRNKESLINLIRSYRSYPEFRNEQTIENLYTRFQNNEPMDYPMVLKFGDGSMRVLGGNTRMDVMFHLGMNPKVIMIEV